ncbi:TonB-dependent receptor plug domain-containing protein [Roseateles sp.]|uniref:TonB-dependent receptor plug domain-containing protein n=1 Tax=Roseateles sp. TaxID=1971397 RepID=UPI003D103845
MTPFPDVRHRRNLPLGKRPPLPVPAVSTGMLIACALAASSARAVPAEASSAPPASQIDRVVVDGESSGASRRDASAAKSIVTREDLARFGDASLIDTLRRVPGITVTGSGTQPRDIRLRGMGNGYTQILINGEPAPAGFSIDALSPELVDRIEVLRTATADLGTQAIAGTINIILRRTAKPGQRDLKMSGGISGGRGNVNMSAQTGGSLAPGWQYGLTGSLAFDNNQYPARIDTEASTPGGPPRFRQHTETLEQARQWTLGLSPRLTWKVDDQRSLNADVSVQGQRVEIGGDERRSTTLGTGSPIRNDLMHIVNESWQLRSTVQLKQPVGSDGRLETKLTVTHLRRTSDGTLDRLDAEASPLVFRSVDSVLSDSAGALVGKYQLLLDEAHTIGLGWDSQLTRRAETRTQRESSPVAFPTEDMDDNYRATIARLALYAQDEWAVTERLSIYAGARWEGLETRTSGEELGAIKHRSSVLSPTLQMVWKIPSTKADQLRVALARTYKAPTARDLLPRRWIVNDNSATRPNFQGNPTLVPELSWGLDAGYERYLSDGGFLGLNAYARRIANVILQRTRDEGGTWISTPVNSGRAEVRGLEMEVKQKLQRLASTWPKLDVRLSASRQWSTIDEVPGPNNRLSQLPAWTATAGADWQPTGSRWATGLQFAFENVGRARISQEQWTRRSNKRALDVYGLWTVSKEMRVRVSWLNVLKPQTVTETQYVTDALSQGQVLRQSPSSVLRVAVEMKL